VIYENYFSLKARAQSNETINLPDPARCVAGLSGQVRFGVGGHAEFRVLFMIKIGDLSLDS
jgi:hypothetical protein